jgi:hypothetical protein
MDGNRFDSWTRTRATVSNRRTMLGWSLTAGIAAALTRLQPANAQFGGGGGNGSCTYNVTLTSSLDPSTSITGSLAIDIGDGGAIDTGSLTLTGQAQASVVGQATGRAIDLLVSLSDGTTLSLTGVGGSDISSCNASILGSLANPDTGQIGTWQTAAGSGGGSGAGGSSGSSSGGSASGGSSGSAPTPTPASGQPGNGGGGGACLELHSQCNASAECCSGWCTDNECRSCGDTICGEDCIVLSDNLAHCGACFNSCDVDTQTCVNGVCTGGDDGGGGDGGGDDDGGGGGCVDIGGACGFGGQCCSGFCNGGACGSCGMVVCNEMCVDTSSDNNNCGNCNNVCIGTNCQNGSCQ